MMMVFPPLAFKKGVTPMKLNSGIFFLGTILFTLGWTSPVQSWTAIPSGVTGDLLSVSVSSSHEAIFGGHSGLFVEYVDSNFSTSNLTSLGIGALLQVDITATGQRRILGQGAYYNPIFRYSNGQWVPENLVGTAYYRDFDSLAAGRIWTAGEGGTLGAYHEPNWSEVTTGNNEMFSAVDAVDYCFAWAVGNGGAIWKHNGATWTVEVPFTPISRQYYGVSAADRHCA